MDTTEIIDKLNKIKQKLILRYPITKLGLFGSYSRRDFSNDSDIDILIEFSEPVGLEFIDISDEIESELGRKVDLVSLKAIKPEYFEYIKDEVIYV